MSLGSAVASAAAAASKSAATSGGSSGDSMTATRGTIPLKADPLEGNSVAGSYGTGGATTAPLYSTSGPVNASTVSAPVQMSSPSSSSSSESTPTQGSSGSWGREGAQNGPAVVIQNQTINSDVDANLFAESVAMKVRARGR